MTKIFYALSWTLIGVGSLVFLLSRILDWQIPNWYYNIFFRPQVVTPTQIFESAAIWTVFMPIAMFFSGLISIVIFQRRKKMSERIKRNREN